MRCLSSLAVLAGSLLWASSGQGRLSGTVSDPSGGVIPNLTVTVEDAAHAVIASAVTGPDGIYDFPHLPPGPYRLRVAQSGFQPYAGSVELTPGSSLRLDISLSLAARRQEVVVTEPAAQVETSSTQMGERINSTKLEGLPVNGRSYTDLLALRPGVVPASSQQPNAVIMSGCTSTPPSGDLNPGNVSVNGQRETTNGFTINGTSAQEGFNMGAAIVPNLDSIEEVRLLTNNFDAEYGNYSGGQVVVTTKSGSNQFHGSAFEYLRNTALDARNFFSSQRATYDRNQFGGTIGGAMVKDKAFFFADYQGTRMRQGIETGLISVPSMEERSGNFSGLASQLTGTVNGQYWANLLTGKLGYGVTAGEPYYFPGCRNPTECVLPNAILPERAWSAPAKALLPYIPQPNVGASLFSTSAYDEQLRDDKGALRGDVNTRWGSFSAYYSADDYRLDNPYPAGQGGATVPGFNAVSTGRAQLATIGLTTILGPSAINELRLGYTRSANHIGQPSGGVGPSLASQGFTGIVPLAPRIEGIENVSFNDFTMGVDITGAVQVNNTYQWSDNFSRVAGKHTFKAGATMHYDQININPDAIYNGSFLFQGTETGSAFADFLLGIPSSYAQGDSRAFYLRDRYIGVYGQDSWQLRPNLTLNYGLRWDVLPPWREKYNQLQTLVPGEQSVVYPGAPAGLVFPGDPGIPATLAPTRWTDFAPRAGLAYSPGTGGKTSLRAGFGVFYTAIEGLSAGIMSANPPYGYDYNSLAPPLFSTPFVTAASGNNVGQRFPEPIPASGATASQPNTTVNWSQYLPVTGVPSFYYRNVTPYTESYTLSLQREVAAQTVVTASYNGSESHHLLVLVSANPGNPALCLSTPACGPFGESGIYSASDGRTIYGTRGPFSSQFAAVTYQKTMSNANYNAFNLSLRRAGPTFELLLGYTYGKSLDQSSSLAEAVNPLNAGLSKAPSAFDMRHSFVASYDWKLPFFRRNRWMGGWSLSGITRFATGLPVTLYNNNDTSLLGTIPNGINNNGVDTPDYTPGNLAVNRNPRNGRPAFDTALFSLPALGQIGTAARRFFYGPGIESFDLALHKSVRLSEKRSIELRAEAFNALNHGQFFGAAAVNGNIGSASFGQIVSAEPPRQIQLAARFSF